ncbi:hypothetical protein J2T08_001686 [Neorhizobium galegae]|uniref:hypothetical protein n=1 Tax=Neorhizobium galegae TaxID=399 RepID=UPI001AE629B0|nr:hypothetical protein [Neorhizobium galegae]MBP2562246.1 hypothetical protein [Neorhizobium galegae]MDQ0133768.1 hypothetical protein [Neorhizobium galegae]
MWVELNNEEVAVVLERVDHPSILEKLKAHQHADAAAFRKAADCFSDYVHVHDDAPIERTRNGAYVMTWLWVPNEQAGFPRLNDFDDYDVSEECLERLEATQRFDVEALDAGAEHPLGCGTVDGCRWRLLLEAGLLTFIVQRGPQSLAWLHAETSREGADKDLEDEPTEERCLRFMLEAISKFREQHSM